MNFVIDMQNKMMKKFTLIVFSLLCFGIAKAHLNILENKFEATGINRLQNYEVPFNTYKIPVRKRLNEIKAEMPHNKLAVEADRTRIEISLMEKDKNGFVRRKLVAQNL